MLRNQADISTQVISTFGKVTEYKTNIKKGNCISIHLQWVSRNKIKRITTYNSLKNKQTNPPKKLHILFPGNYKSFKEVKNCVNEKRSMLLDWVINAVKCQYFL